MARNNENSIQIVEKNEGTKIDVEQRGKKIAFGDDDLVIRCDNRQRDIPVTVDVCADDNNNLVIGVGVGRYYVAQVDIPATRYTEVEDDPDPENPNSTRTHMEPVPLDMGDVVVTLWSLDDLTPSIQ